MLRLDGGKFFTGTNKIFKTVKKKRSHEEKSLQCFSELRTEELHQKHESWIMPTKLISTAGREKKKTYIRLGACLSSVSVSHGFRGGSCPGLRIEMAIGMTCISWPALGSSLRRKEKGVQPPSIHQ